ncbi:MAG TPA: hypothetical protein VJ577_21075 [Burkholderiaceae bacterium]|nr:hypothetical protein [Burkholderiaceae bacterium]
MILSNIKSLGVAALLGILLAACGGAKKDSSQDSSAVVNNPGPPPVVLPTTTVSGVFDGHLTDSGQALTTLLQADGSYYMVYSDLSAAQAPAGAILGTGTLANGSFTSTNALNLSLTGTGAQTTFGNAAMQASYVPNVSFNGVLTYPAPGTPLAFNGAFNSAYSQLPPLASLAGVYAGVMTTRSVKEDNLELTISSSGEVTGKLTCGCTIMATLATRVDATSYVASLSFVGGSHPLSNQSMAGNVYFDATKKRLYIIGKMSDTGEGTIFVGTRS